ncbi:MAG: bifunctional hydroxymethylpyrimidine kinase/phosphomethylpyrimidine kinase [Verrucomicrobia bacterium]|nr:MAG: bifunctional hydroxymethylpyrimidine kinase/phosphomethylpyrimidine kinase [Verrucomicrobiota bacterium]
MKGLPKSRARPVALTIAGSDSGGQAGIQADLRTFGCLGVHGVCVITAITAQNQKHVLGIEPCSTRIVRRQLQAVFEQGPVKAMKTGMLYSAACVRAVASFLRKQPRLPLIVDPVLISTSGRRLLEASALRALIRELLPLAALVTPNVHEAEVLAAKQLRTPEDLRIAVRIIYELFGCAVLVKGGHLSGIHDAVDIFYDGRQELMLSAPFVRGLKLHGTGCTYSAAITAWLARGLSLAQSVQRAKRYITDIISGL